MKFKLKCNIILITLIKYMSLYLNDIKDINKK